MPDELTAPDGPHDPYAVDDEEDFDGEESERQIAEFVAAAEAAGADVAGLADAVVAIAGRARDEAAALLSEQGTNAIIAVMLRIGQQVRTVDPRDPAYWRLSAASTLATGLIPTPPEDSGA